jgi:hypothetical protein
MRSEILACVCVFLLTAFTSARSASLKPAPYCTEVDFVDRDHAEQQEANCLQTQAQSVTRQGNVLRLKLDNSTFKVYRSNPAACDRDDADHCVHYWLVGYLEAAHFYIVLTGDYDDFGCIFVSARDGTETKVGGIPHFAPDGSTFIVIIDLDGFAIGSVGSSPSLTRMDWTTDSNDGEFWRFQRWLDIDHVALRFEGRSSVCPDGNCEAVLARIGNSWRLQRKIRSR